MYIFHIFQRNENFVNFFSSLYGLSWQVDFPDQSFQFIRDVHRVFIASRTFAIGIWFEHRVQPENIPWELDFAVGIILV